MVYENKNLILAIFEIISLYIEGWHNNQRLFFVSFILYFYNNYLLREKSDWIPLA